LERRLNKRELKCKQTCNNRLKTPQSINQMGRVFDQASGYLIGASACLALIERAQTHRREQAISRQYTTRRSWGSASNRISRVRIDLISSCHQSTEDTRSRAVKTIVSTNTRSTDTYNVVAHSRGVWTSRTISRYQ
jgi:hypothetical protein